MVVGLIDGYANKPQSPPVVKTVWGKTKEFVGKWAGAPMIQPQGQAAPAAARTMLAAAPSETTTAVSAYKLTTKLGACSWRLRCGGQSPGCDVSRVRR